MEVSFEMKDQPTCTMFRPTHDLVNFAAWGAEHL